MPTSPMTYTVKEAAAALRFDVDTIYVMIAQHRLKTTRPTGPRGQHRIPVEEIDRLREEQAQREMDLDRGKLGALACSPTSPASAVPDELRLILGGFDLSPFLAGPVTVTLQGVRRQ